VKREYTWGQDTNVKTNEMAIFKLNLKHYSDAAYVEGVYRYDPIMERGLHKLCKEYYDKNFHKPNVGAEGMKDIFQSSLLALWDNIRNRRLYVEDGELKGNDGEPFTSTLTTYFMGIVNYTFLGWLRKNPTISPIKPEKEKVPENFSEEDVMKGFKDDDEVARRKRIVSHRIDHMAKQCNKILTYYYYEEKTYDEIMELMPTFKSKDALKTAKYKCLKRLRESVTGTYC
jgi:DNA-directed RNA polymerase specialized sigma24 family protein